MLVRVGGICSCSQRIGCSRVQRAEWILMCCLFAWMLFVDEVLGKKCSPSQLFRHLALEWRQTQLPRYASLLWTLTSLPSCNVTHVITLLLLPKRRSSLYSSTSLVRDMLYDIWYLLVGFASKYVEGDYARRRSAGAFPYKAVANHWIGIS